jgi:hypothetical protein
MGSVLMTPLLTCRSRRRAALLAVVASFWLAVLAASPAPALAHEGHDHSAQPAISAAAPRLESSSRDFELVGVVRGDRLVVFLDQYASNDPVTDARIEINAQGATVPAQPQSDGTFLVPAPWLSQPGTVDLVFVVTAGGTSDLLVARLTYRTPLRPRRRRAPNCWRCCAGSRYSGGLVCCCCWSVSSSVECWRDARCLRMPPGRKQQRRCRYR